MKQHIAGFLILLMGLFVLFSCTKKYPDQTQMDLAIGGDGCTSCHMNTDLLKEVATPQEDTEGDAGEG